MENLKGRLGLLLGMAGILLFGLVFLVSCQNKSAQEQVAEKMVEKAIKEGTGKEANVDIQGGKIRIQSKDGASEINVTNSWPEDMPGDVPLFTMGKIKGVNKSTIEGKKSWSVVIDEAQEGAFPKYVEELKAKAWKIDMNLSMGKGGSTAASKNNLNLMVIFDNDQKSGSISVTMK